jgi:predicted nucleotidyltransferase
MSCTEALLLDLANNQDLRPLAILIRDVRAVDAKADVMLVGAMARDVLLLHAYGVRLPRATTDVDIALAVGDWTAFHQLRNALLASGKFASKTTVLHKLVHVGLNIPIDLIPFAGVEDSQGNIAWPPDNAEVMSLIGYREARASAVMLNLPDKQQVAMVSLPMLAVLKVLAWIERHRTEPRKDARDLDTILGNYLKAGNGERLYTEAAHLLDSKTYDYNLAGGWMCGRDARTKLEAHSQRLPQILAAANKMLESETDPDGPLTYVGEIQSGNPDQTRKLLAAFSAGINLKATP